MIDARLEALEREVAALREQLQAGPPRASRHTRDALVERVLGDRVVLESLPEVVCVLDRCLTLLYLNRAMPGRDLPDLLGTCALDLVAAEHRDRYRDAFELAWCTGEH